MNFYVIWKYVFMTIIGLFLNLILIPILFPFALLFGFVCAIAQIAIKIKYGLATRKARGTDVIHGKKTAHSFPIINIAIRIKGKLNKALICERTLALINEHFNTNSEKTYKRLTEIYSSAFGYNIWKPFDKFNVEDHVKMLSLDDIYGKSKNNGETIEKYVNKSFTKNESKTEDFSDSKIKWHQLMKLFLDKYGTNLFDEDKPQWEMLIVKDDKESYTVLYRFHHAISDGIYLSRMFCEDMIDVPYFLFPKFKPPHPAIRFLTSIWSFTLLPFGLWNIVCNRDRNPLHGKRLSGKKRFFLSEKIPMESLRLIQANFSMRVSMHSIIFSCVSYTLAKHFYRRNHIIPTVTALTPIPLQNKSHPIKLKNKFAVGGINFPVSLTMADPTNGKGSTNKVEKSALRRLHLVKASLREMAQDISLLPLNSLINGFCSVLPTAIAEQILSVSGCTLAISHLPGAKVQTKIYDGEIIDHMFWIPDREPMGVGFSIYSYNGFLRVGLLIDNALMKSDQDGFMMMENFKNEVSNLLSETMESIAEKDDEKRTEKLQLIP